MPLFDAAKNIMQVHYNVRTCQDYSTINVLGSVPIMQQLKEEKAGNEATGIYTTYQMIAMPAVKMWGNIVCHRSQKGPMALWYCTC